MRLSQIIDDNGLPRARGDRARRKPSGEGRAHDARSRQPRHRSERVAAQARRRPRRRRAVRPRRGAQGEARAPADRLQADPGPPMVSGTGLTHLGSAESRDSDAREARRPGEAHEFHAHVQARAGGRQADAAARTAPSPNGSTRARLHRGSARGRPRSPVVRAGRGRRAGDRGRLPHRSRGSPGSPGLRLGNEFADHVDRAGELSLARPFEARGRQASGRSC